MKIELSICVLICLVQASLSVHGPKQLFELFKDEDGEANGDI